MPSKVVLYIASSLDGFIAQKDGSVAFLDEAMPSPAPDTGYDAFYATVGAVIMGGKTYRQVTQELSPDVWPYQGKPSYIYTKTPLDKQQLIYGVTMPPEQLIKQIGQVKGDIWLLGGGEIIKLFLNAGVVDRLIIHVMPVLLGEGIPLFPPGFVQTKLKLENTRIIGDIVELTYERA